MNTNELNEVADYIIKNVCGIIKKELDALPEPRDKLILLYLIDTELKQALNAESALICKTI